MLSWVCCASSVSCRLPVDLASASTSASARSTDCTLSRRRPPPPAWFAVLSVFCDGACPASGERCCAYSLRSDMAGGKTAASGASTIFANTNVHFISRKKLCGLAACALGLVLRLHVDEHLGTGHRLGKRGFETVADGVRGGDRHVARHDQV